MTKFFYLTAPIFYPNERLHLGHAYTMVVADIIVRYKKSQGYQVYFQTGSDDHGEKIAKKAAALNTSPAELVAKNGELFQELWQKLNISSHNFYRTSTPQHHEKVQKIFAKLLERGDICLGKYQGNYCVTCEDYVSLSQSKNNFCAACQTSLKTIAEKAYFLRISQYQKQLLDYWKETDFLSPPTIKNELFNNFLREPLLDLCITRSDVE
jgi:methionyl-tRNA synthetase